MSTNIVKQKRSLASRALSVLKQIPAAFRRGFRVIVSEQDWQVIRKPVISVFILFHWILNFNFMFNTHPFMNNIVHFFWGYYHFFGLDQDFGVFAPIVRNNNPHLIALINYKDGSTRLWMNPRMERLDFLTRIQKERYRKFFDDNMCNQMYKSLWPDLTAYIARTNYDDPQNPPQMVTLLKFYAIVLPPDKGIRMKNGPHFIKETLLTYRVLPEDLK